MKKIFSIVTLTTMLIGSLAAVALATTSTTTYPSGGQWTYGYNGPNSGYYMGFSYYYHPTNVHTSTVGLSGTLYRSPLTEPGYTSDANSPSVQTSPSNFSYYYNPNA